MLSHLNNILLKKNILLNSNHNIYCDLTNFNFYESIVNECKQHLLNKEIKFDNIHSSMHIVLSSCSQYKVITIVIKIT